MKAYAVALTMMLTGTLTSCQDTAVREDATIWQGYNYTPTQCVEDTASAELLPPESLRQEHKAASKQTLVATTSRMRKFSPGDHQKTAYLQLTARNLSRPQKLIPGWKQTNRFYTCG